MVTLLLREFAYTVYEFQSFAKVGEREGLRDVMFFDDAPAVHLPFEDSKLLTLERRDASSAWHACFGCYYSPDILGIILSIEALNC